MRTRCQEVRRCGACDNEPTYLPDDGALKHNEHKQGEQAVVPVLIEHPQCDAEYLEYEERRSRVLTEELGEGRDGMLNSLPP